MSTVSLQELRQDPDGLLDRVEAGEHLVVGRGGRPVAELRPVPASQPSRQSDPCDNIRTDMDVQWRPIKGSLYEYRVEPLWADACPSPSAHLLQEEGKSTQATSGHQLTTTESPGRISPRTARLGKSRLNHGFFAADIGLACCHGHERFMRYITALVIIIEASRTGPTCFYVPFKPSPFYY
jgi:antitoxin (DNA-binding transcriptional repressor) of toxin-antitoxin stability system